MKKKILPNIKALAPETAEVMEADSRVLVIEMAIDVSINGDGCFSVLDSQEYDNFYDALVDIRATLQHMYDFLNANLGTHYVVKNDTESNMKDLGYK